MSSSAFKPTQTYCTLCLRAFEAVNHHQLEVGLCPSCRAQADRRKQAQKPKKKPKTGLTLNEVSARAKEAGMTYGVYVAKMDL